MRYCIGNDECGYGAVAGNLIICGLRAPEDWTLEGLRDSKKLKPKKRAQLRDQLLVLADKGEIAYHIAERTHTEIDERGVYNVLKEAHIEVLKALYKDGDRCIVDGNLSFKKLGVDDLNIESIIKADNIYSQVMAASIIGKVFRDEKMKRLYKDYPEYEWNINFGYPVERHLDAIEKYGITPLHRMSYRPMKEMTNIKYYKGIDNEEAKD